MANQHPAIKVAEWNCNSIKSKTDELRILVGEHNIDILVLMEIKIEKDDDLRTPSGYKSIVNNRNKHGGGIAIIFKDNIELKNIDIPNIQDKENCETITADIYITGTLQFKLTGVYIPDGFRTWNITNVLEKLIDSKSIVCGDFNAHDPQLPEVVNRAANTSGKRVCEIIQNSDEVTLLSKGLPTHIYGGQTDLWLCSSDIKHRIQSDPGIQGNYHSDHFVSIIEVECQTNTSNEKFPHHRFQFNRANWQLYANMLEELTKRIVIPTFVNKDTTQIIENTSKVFAEAIREAATRSIPRVPVHKVDNYKISRTMKTILKKEHQLTRLAARNNGDPYIRGLIKKLRSKFQQCKIEEALKASHRKMRRMEKERRVDARKFFQCYRELTSKSLSNSTPSTLKNKEGQYIIDDKGKAEVFREYWQNQFNPNINGLLGTNQEIENHWALIESLAKNEALSPLEDGSATPIKKITREEIRFAIRKLKLKAPGKDEVSNILIKKAGNTFVTKLRTLYNLSLAVGYVPTSWKIAVIVNIPKPGKDHLEPNGYRPISLLSCLGKLLELILTFRLRDCMEQNNIIPNHQSGFYRKRGTQDQLFRLSQMASLSRLKKETFVTALLDFKGAFNAVWHNGLRAKILQCEHIDSSMKRWLSSFLKDRTFVVRVGHTFSKSTRIGSGVPQGSALSPLLFAFFTADVIDDNSSDQKAFPASYADDIAIMAFAVVPGLAEARVSAALRKITRWTNLWRLPLGKEKCIVIKFWKHKGNFPVFLGDHKLEEVQLAKYLGLSFDTNLTWSPHFDNIVSEVKRRLACLVKLNKLGASFETKKQVYISLIRPVLEYGCVAFLCASEKQKNRLYKLQNQALRIICQVRLEDKHPIKELEKRCNIIPLWERWIQLSAKFGNRAISDIPSVGELIKRHALENMNGTPLGKFRHLLAL